MGRKKVTVIADELGFTGGGLYAIFPFDKLDKNGKGVFKIGMTTGTFRRRFESYHTSFPGGFYTLALLGDPPVQGTRGSAAETKHEKYHAIEEYILEWIQMYGGSIVYSTTRVNRPNTLKEGRTEWVYCTLQTLHDAFENAHTWAKGRLELYKFPRPEKQSGQTFTGQITIPVEKN